RDQQMEEIDKLLRFSMNQVDQPSMFRGNVIVDDGATYGREAVRGETRDAVRRELERGGAPGAGAGELPEGGGVDLPPDWPGLAVPAAPVEAGPPVDDTTLDGATLDEAPEGGAPIEDAPV